MEKMRLAGTTFERAYGFVYNRCDRPLRIGDFRVFCNVDLDESLVKIEAIGYKEGSTLFVHGEEYEL